MVPGLLPSGNQEIGASQTDKIRQIIAGPDGHDIGAQSHGEVEQVYGSISWRSGTSGTSIASPHVCGGVALYLGKDPSLSPNHIWLPQLMLQLLNHLKILQKENPQSSPVTTLQWLGCQKMLSMVTQMQIGEVTV